MTELWVDRILDSQLDRHAEVTAAMVKGLAAARAKGACSVAFTSARGTELASAAGLALVVPAEETARIQEMHVLALHLISELVDRWACETDTVNN